MIARPPLNQPRHGDGIGDGERETLAIDRLEIAFTAVALDREFFVTSIEFDHVAPFNEREERQLPVAVRIPQPDEAGRVHVEPDAAMHAAHHVQGAAVFDALPITDVLDTLHFIPPCS